MKMAMAMNIKIKMKIKLVMKMKMKVIYENAQKGSRVTVDFNAEFIL